MFKVLNFFYIVITLKFCIMNSVILRTTLDEYEKKTYQCYQLITAVQN